MPKPALVVTCLLLVVGSLTWTAAGPAAPGPQKSGTTDAPTTDRPETLRALRHEAAALHTAIHSTLQAVHQQYYRENEGLPLPAALLQEVFADLKEEHQVTLRWLAVEGQAMNADHQPRTPFEREAFAALKAGKGVYEQVEAGVYRRAAAITLSNQCLKCHVPDRKSTEDRTAGLIISLPLPDR